MPAVWCRHPREALWAWQQTPCPSWIILPGSFSLFLESEEEDFLSKAQCRHRLGKSPKTRMYWVLKCRPLVWGYWWKWGCSECTSCLGPGVLRVWWRDSRVLSQCVQKQKQTHPKNTETQSTRSLGGWWQLLLDMFTIQLFGCKQSKFQRGWSRIEKMRGKADYRGENCKTKQNKTKDPVLAEMVVKMHNGQNLGIRGRRIVLRAAWATWDCVSNKANQPNVAKYGGNKASLGYIVSPSLKTNNKETPTTACVDGLLTISHQHIFLV